MSHLRHVLNVSFFTKLNLVVSHHTLKRALATANFFIIALSYYPRKLGIAGMGI
jgi:BarA-like signal transduction histidine kinase